MTTDKKTYVFDIDGTICTHTIDKTYLDIKPYSDRVQVINSLYDEGHEIIFYTARGMGRHKNNTAKAFKEFYDMTTKQLESWEIKYNQLFLGKPAGDIYVDDKGIQDTRFFPN